MDNKIINNHTINLLLNIIVNKAHPNKVILFGSHARGDAREDSDYDFIILKHSIENERDVTRPIYRELCESSIPVSVDLIACSFEKWEKRYLPAKDFLLFRESSSCCHILYLKSFVTPVYKTVLFLFVVM